jgi:hypothetical protein
LAIGTSFERAAAGAKRLTTGPVCGWGHLQWIRLR